MHSIMHNIPAGCVASNLDHTAKLGEIVNALLHLLKVVPYSVGLVHNLEERNAKRRLEQKVIDL